MSRAAPTTQPAGRPSPAREIRALPPLLVNQIAAGEVVERPASVVKELFDNAIDAGATRIAIDLEQGGIELVRVTDDGCGVPPAQAALMLAPHATSKIAAAEDLDRIATMGFRGEALASITSVARLSVRSRTRNEPGAWLIEAEGDRIGEPRPEAGPAGTCVTVRTIFFNTPARRKFLRTPAGEQQACLDMLRDLAMSHPAVGLRVTTDGRTQMDLPADQSPRERVLAILGRELEGELLEVDAERTGATHGPPTGVVLWGLVGRPSIARATARALRVFVNGRPVRDKTVMHALQEAYRGLIEPGRKPTAALFLDMPPHAVDVNVHPAKAEVRFRDSSLIHSLVLHAVRDALRRADLAPAVRFGGGGAAPAGREPVMGPGVGPFAAPPVRVSPEAFVDYFKRFAGGPQKGFPYAEARAAVDAARAQEADAPPQDASAQAAPEPQPPDPDPAVPMLAPAPTPAQRILQVHNSFIVTQDAEGLVIIDQHALHERVMFEALSARLAQGPLESQRLLTPTVVRLTPAQVDRLPDLRPTLARLGVEAAALGPDSVGVHAFPTFLFERGVEPGAFLAELAEKAEADGFAAGEEEAVHEVVDMMACKAAVKAGDRLSDEELDALLRLREQVERSSNCPHGRPTTIRLSIRDLERQFGRG